MKYFVWRNYYLDEIFVTKLKIRHFPDELFHPTKSVAPISSYYIWYHYMSTDNNLSNLGGVSFRRAIFLSQSLRFITFAQQSFAQ